MTGKRSSFSFRAASRGETRREGRGEKLPLNTQLWEREPTVHKAPWGKNNMDNCHTLGKYMTLSYRNLVHGKKHSSHQLSVHYLLFSRKLSCWKLSDLFISQRLSHSERRSQHKDILFYYSLTFTSHKITLTGDLLLMDDITHREIPPMTYSCSHSLKGALCL